jgi:antigen flippase
MTAAPESASSDGGDTSTSSALVAGSQPPTGKQHDVKSAGRLAFSGTACYLVLTLLTGAILSRALGPAGKGVFTALTTTPVVLAWFFQVGSADAVAYFLALHPRRAGATLSGWLRVVAISLTVGGIATALLAPVVIGAQPEHWVHLAWICGFFIPVLGLWELGLGALLGLNRFVLVTCLRVANPLLLLVAYSTAHLITGQLTTGLALIISASINTAMVIGIWIGIIVRHRPAAATSSFTREMLAFGFKGQFASLGHIINARLDLFLVPAILGSSDVGFYSVATSVSVVVLAGSTALTDFIVPLVRREGADPVAVMRAALRITTLVTGVLTVILFIGAPLALRIVYGSQFSPAVDVLDIVLPGVFLYGIARVALQGIYGAGHPTTATLCQLTGVLVLGIGFAGVVILGGGMLAVATVSSCSYAAVFVAVFAVRSRIRPAIPAVSPPIPAA